MEPAGDLRVTIEGEDLVLLAERAVYWPGEETLLVADPHFGKAAAFRVSGIPVPSGTTGDALERLTSAVLRTCARKVTFLGDLLHAKAGRSKGMFDALATWRDAHPRVEVVLVRGNHDRAAGDPPKELAIECVNSPHRAGPFVLAHYPIASADGYVLAGHVHPCVRLYGAGRQRVRLPCFVFGPKAGILPAFGDFTGFADSDPEPHASVYAIADGMVVQVE